MSGPTDYANVSLFIRIDQVGAALGLIFVAVTNVFFLQNRGLWLVVPLLLALSIGLVGARQAIDRGDITLALGLVAVANWVVALGIPILLPFLWPVMALTILMPLILASPHLNRSQVVPAVVATAVMSAAVAAIGLLNDDGGVIDDIDDALELIVVSGSLVAQIVPIGLVAWQHNELQRSNVANLRQLNDELRVSEIELASSRDRVVRAADTERRRIERDLHDGAQQRLVALGVRLRLLQSQSHQDPAVTGTVDILITELDGAIDEVRELAHGIYPPLLQTRGLPDALAAVVRRSALDVRTTIDELTRFDVPIETALYFTALEALTNATKHAPGAAVHLQLGLEADQLVLRVVDDGPGFDAAAVNSSHGFDNMADRLAVVGGTLTVTSDTGTGTTVTASVPA